MQKSYKKLIVWQEGYKFILDVYRVTKNFPGHEMYGVTSQLRRAAVSILANIVEGQAKHSVKDFVRFLYISKGSLRECEFFIELSRDLGYCKQEEFERLEKRLNKTAFLLHKLILSFQKPSQPT